MLTFFLLTKELINHSAVWPQQKVFYSVLVLCWIYFFFFFVSSKFYKLVNSFCVSFAI